MIVTFIISILFEIIKQAYDPFKISKKRYYKKVEVISFFNY